MTPQDNTSVIFETMCDHFSDITPESTPLHDIQHLVLQTMIWARANTYEFPNEQVAALYATYVTAPRV